MSWSVGHVVSIVVWDFPPGSIMCIIFNQSNALANQIEGDESASVIFHFVPSLQSLYPPSLPEQAPLKNIQYVKDSRKIDPGTPSRLFLLQ